VAALADDHRVKAQNWKANQASRYCRNNGTRCDELEIEDLEGRWEQRELGYRISFISLSSVGIAAVIVASALGRRAEALGSRRRPPSAT
jgi:hypothetical protein